MNKANNSKKIIALVALVALVAILAVCLVACNQKDYEKRLKDAGYRVEGLSANDDLGVEDAEVEWGIAATKLKSADFVTVVKFKNTDDAKDCESAMGKLFEVKRSGKIVIFGTEQGVKDAQ